MTALIPKPKVDKKPITVEIEKILYEKVKLQAKIEGLTLRQIVEYGLSKFLEERKPK